MAPVLEWRLEALERLHQLLGKWNSGPAVHHHNHRAGHNDNGLADHDPDGDFHHCGSVNHHNDGATDHYDGAANHYDGAANHLDHNRSLGHPTIV